MYLGSESSKTALPIAFRASSNILCLPFYSDLTNYQIEQVVVAIKKAIDSIKLPIE
jgi:dTDP-4-amino-4,6-dideoxygalactose transaminase